MTSDRLNAALKESLVEHADRRKHTDRFKTLFFDESITDVAHFKTLLFDELITDFVVVIRIRQK